MAKGKLPHVTARLPDWLADELAAAAEALQLSRSAVARVAIADWLQTRRLGEASRRGAQATREAPRRGAQLDLGVSGEAPGRGALQDPYPPPHPPIKRSHTECGSEAPRGDARPPAGPDLPALFTELCKYIADKGGPKIHPHDGAAQHTLWCRLSGVGLAPSDAGPATVEQVKAVVADCVKAWVGTKYAAGLTLQTMLGPKFWEYHARIGLAGREADDNDEPAGPQYQGWVLNIRFAPDPPVYSPVTADGFIVTGIMERERPEGAFLGLFHPDGKEAEASWAADHPDWREIYDARPDRQRTTPRGAGDATQHTGDH